MNFTYENQGTHTYLVYALTEMDEIDTMSLGMLTNNRIPGFANVSFTQMDTTKYIKFDVSSKVPVKQLFSGPVSRKRLLGVFCGVVDAMLSAEDYMLDPRSVILDTNYIFADVSTCETEMICLPITAAEGDNHDIAAFFKNIVFTTQFDNTEDCDHVAQILNYLNSNPILSLHDFKNMLDEIGRGAHAAAVQPVQPAQQPVQQPVPQPAAAQVRTEPQKAPEAPQTPMQPPVAQQPVKPMTPNGVNIPENVRPGVAIPGQAPVNAPAAPGAGQAEEKRGSFFQIFQGKKNKGNAAAPAVGNGGAQNGPAPQGGFAIPGQQPAQQPGGFQKPAPQGAPQGMNGGWGKPAPQGGFQQPPKQPGGFAIPGQKPGGFQQPAQPQPAQQPGGFQKPAPQGGQQGAPGGWGKPAPQGGFQQPPKQPGGFAIPGQKPGGFQQPAQPQPAQQPGGFQKPAPQGAPQGMNGGWGKPAPQGGFQQPPKQPGGFAIPGQKPGGFQQAPQQPGGFQQAPQQPGGFQQAPQQPGGFQQAPQQPGGFQQAPQQSGGFQQAPQQPGGFQQAPQQPAGKPASFGETTVLSTGMGETTVLSATMEPTREDPHLIRIKNNERIPLNKPVFRIGKEKSYVDYFVGDNTAVSRGHANIVTRDGEYYVVDTNSLNHTFVDGVMSPSGVETKLTDGAKIRLANEEFEFRLH